METESTYSSQCHNIHETVHDTKIGLQSPPPPTVLVNRAVDFDDNGLVSPLPLSLSPLPPPLLPCPLYAMPPLLPPIPPSQQVPSDEERSAMVV